MGWDRILIIFLFEISLKLYVKVYQLPNALTSDYPFSLSVSNIGTGPYNRRISGSILDRFETGANATSVTFYLWQTSDTAFPIDYGLWSIQLTPIASV